MTTNMDIIGKPSSLKTTNMDIIGKPPFPKD